MPECSLRSGPGATAGGPKGPGAHDRAASFPLCCAQTGCPTRPEPRPTWYRFEDATLRQSLRVVQVSARTIRFRLVDSLKTTGQCRLLAGTATALAGDPEIDEGADGTAYPAVAYNYQGACFLSVRIELNTRQRAQLVSDNCHTAHADATIEHSGILYRGVPGGK